MIFNMVYGKVPMTVGGTKTITLFHFDSVPITPDVGTGTVNNSSSTVRPGKFTNAVYIYNDASNNHFQYTGNELILKKDPFTCEFFCKSNLGIVMRLFSYNSHFIISVSSNGVEVRYANSAAYAIYASKISTTNFIHCALVGDGGIDGQRKFSLFLDGEKKGEKLCDYFINSNVIHAHHGITAYLDELRISNVARYSENFTPPTAPFTPD